MIRCKTVCQWIVDDRRATSVLSILIQAVKIMWSFVEIDFQGVFYTFPFSIKKCTKIL